MGLTIRTVSFASDGVAFEYQQTPEDALASGVVRTHALFVPDDGAHADNLEDVLETCKRALRRALRDFEIEPVAELDDGDDGDDGLRPYDHPTDRGTAVLFGDTNG